MNKGPSSRVLSRKPRATRAKMMLRIFAIVFVGLIAYAACDSQIFSFYEDAQMSAQMEKVRESFLASRPGPFDRLDVTLLLPMSPGVWRRASAGNQNATNYPASCVKLTYLTAAMHTAQQMGYDCNFLDLYVDPMITVSDNLQTGNVVDILTGAPNDLTLQWNTSEFNAWWAKRNFTAAWLDSRGLLENMTVLHKTYPTNSGQSPIGAEAVLREYAGMNAINTRLAASIMLEISQGEIVPECYPYMRSILTHSRFGDEGPIGFGLPPGTDYQNKPGLAYNDLNDIAHVVLPNGQEFVMAILTDSYNSVEASQPTPYFMANPGVYAEMVIDALNLCEGCPAKLKISHSDSAPLFTTSGSWQLKTDRPDALGGSYLTATSAASAEWDFSSLLNTTDIGLYELAVWSPQSDSFTSAAEYSINYFMGTATFGMDQTHNGGRWVYIGDYLFAPGNASITLTVSSFSSSSMVVANGVKLTRWPNCGPAQGHSCFVPPGTNNFNGGVSNLSMMQKRQQQQKKMSKKGTQPLKQRV